MIVWDVSHADGAVNTITKAIQETGMLPEILVQSYSTSLSGAYPEAVQRFYSNLAEKCPQALYYFDKVKRTQG